MKKRIIPSILVNQGTNVFLSRQFSPWRSIAALTQNLRLHVQRHADELLLINLNCAGHPDPLISPRIFSIVRNEVDIPIAYAGGISSLNAASNCINSGFDKVYVTSLLHDNPAEIEKISAVIGNQSLGLCIPYQLHNNSHFVWDYRNREFTDLSLKEALIMALNLGVGEVLLYNSEYDGSLNGLDMSITQLIKDLNLPIPILLAGGAGSPEHFSSALLTDQIQGVVAGSIFALTQETPLTIRDHCLKLGIQMRRP